MTPSRLESRPARSEKMLRLRLCGRFGGRLPAAFYDPALF